jgi:dihydrofolate synthase/folylpolyglutamate synthase
MNYTEALEFVHSIPKFRRPLGNANLRRLLECLGSPQERLKFIHIAGTNGKGSTAAMIACEESRDIKSDFLPHRILRYLMKE